MAKRWSWLPNEVVDSLVLEMLSIGLAEALRPWSARKLALCGAGLGLGELWTLPRVAVAPGWGVFAQGVGPVAPEIRSYVGAGQEECRTIQGMINW